MTTRILDYLRQHALAAAAFVCSILALAGSSYAAFTISGSQIRNHTINPSKFNPKYINGEVRAWAIVGPDGNVIAGRGKPRVSLLAGDPGGYGIKWGVKVRRELSRREPSLRNRIPERVADPRPQRRRRKRAVSQRTAARGDPPCSQVTVSPESNN